MKVELSIIIFIGMLGFVGLAEAQNRGRSQHQTVPTFVDEGRDPVLISTPCHTDTWSTVVSSEPISRGLLVFAPVDNTDGVCISSTNVAADTCTTSRPGIDLEPSASWTDYTSAAWYCKSYSGTQRLKGYRSTDRGDFGSRSVIR